MVVGVGRLLGLHLLEIETSPGRMKPTGPWTGAEAWVACRRGISTASRVPEGSAARGDVILYASLIFSSPALSPPTLGTLFSLSLPHHHSALGKTALGWGGGGDPVGQGSRTTPQAPSHQGPRFTQLQNDWDRLQGPLARVFSGQDAAPFRESLKSGCFQCPGLTQHLCLF